MLTKMLAMQSFCCYWMLCHNAIPTLASYPGMHERGYTCHITIPTNILVNAQLLDVLGTVEKDESVEPNAVQQAFLFWTFQKSARLERVRELVGEGCEAVEDYFTPITYHEFKRSTTSAPLLGLVTLSSCSCKLLHSYTHTHIHIHTYICTHTHTHSAVGCRIREGFFLKDILVKGTTSCCLDSYNMNCLVLPKTPQWKCTSIIHGNPV